MGNNFDTKNNSNVFNVRLAADAKHLPEKGDQGAVTFLFFYYGTKNGQDIPTDLVVKRGAALAANYKKGDIVSASGPLHFYTDKKGTLRGKLYANEVVSSVPLKARAFSESPETSADGGAAASEDTDLATAFD